MWSINYLRQYLLIFSLIVAISFLTVSCGENKISQCQKIINIVNQAVVETGNATNGGKTKDHKAILKAADATEKIAAQMESIKISDGDLRKFQTGFIQMYKDMSRSTREIVNGLNKREFTAVDTGLKNWQKAYSAENQLVTGINSYCSNK